ncbi:MAG: shikimate dehydrogenase family protein [Actinomycetota bacterium]
MDLFPRWTAVLHLDATVEGRDLPIGAAPQVYRDAIEEIARDASVRGALVTTHKVDVFRHAGDLFDDLDVNARLCREVSSISKRAGRLIGHAKDPITAGKSMERIFAGRRPPRHVLCLGAGGAGTAISVYLLRHADPPERIVMVDRDPRRIEDLRTIHGDLDIDSAVEYVVQGNPAENDALLVDLSEESLVINATGMGKDTPGSPLAGGRSIPARSIVWELNYRGELDFLRQARAQSKGRDLEIHDGWIYFLHGWSEVIAEVFDIVRAAERFEELMDAAEPLRP